MALEQRNHELMAENEDLRARLAQYEALTIEDVGPATDAEKRVAASLSALLD